MTELSSPLPAYASDGRRGSAYSELSTMIIRSLRVSLRNVDGLITALVLPVMLMLMFVYLFGGAIQVGTRYVDYVVPGVLVVCVGFGAGTTAVTVSADLAGGIIDRFRSLDVRPGSLLAGHVVASLARNLMSAAAGARSRFLDRVPLRRRSGAVAAGGRAPMPVRARHSMARGGDRHRGALPRGRPGDHLPDRLPAISLQRVRAHPHDAVRASGVRTQPTGHGGDRFPARAAERSRSGAAAWHAVLWSVAIAAVSVLVAGGLFRKRMK